MTHGIVDDLQARIDVTLCLPDGSRTVIQFVIDTGFAGALTLPMEQVAAFALPYVQEINANLANDSTVRADVHVATIVWDGREIDVALYAMGKRPLLGTALLAQKELVAQFTDNGIVTIDDL
jgi:clan AA aspartic protease